MGGFDKVSAVAFSRPEDIAHGVLAAHAKDRARVVPGPTPEPPEPTQLGLAFDGEANELERSLGTKGNSRHPWAWLMQRVFAHEVLVCQRCEGPMRLVKIVNDSDEIAQVLGSAGLGPLFNRPPRRRPTPSGQLLLDFAYRLSICVALFHTRRGESSHAEHQNTRPARDKRIASLAI